MRAMRKPIVIGLERDGVINEHRNFTIRTTQQFVPIESSLEAIALLRSKGCRICIITNQDGIATGMVSQEAIEGVHDHMFKLLGEAGCPSIDALYFSSSTDKQDYYAKPNLGMFHRCQKENPSLSFKNGFYIGHTIKDLKSADKIGATPILVRTGLGQETENNLKKFTYRKLYKKTKIFNNLMEFAQTI